MNVECPHCKATIQVPVSNAGEVANCPYCTGQFTLPIPPNYQPNHLPPPGSHHGVLPDYQRFVDKKLVAGFLGIVFGALGIHKFVLGLESGKIMLGISLLGGLLGCCIGLPLLTFVAMTFVGLVEGVIYITTPDEKFYENYAVHKKQWF